ncbi:hypothetical protein M231_05299 [Tremella mesenterica]|uniref:Thaumatin-like protein n=1 Tax=Tremella mesenterica TaxID=5217 RepID=A0A4Q1BIC9_TREME|nr:hypothetical protein M231_05299 [Tremella mesenterica]
MLLFNILTSISIVSARTITVVNSCSDTIWPALFTGSGDAPTQATGFELDAGQSTSFPVPDNWTAGRIWARTGCSGGTCLSGQCTVGAAGGDTCTGTGVPPATLAEFTLSSSGGVDNYDVSLVDGFNIPVSITSGSCPTAECAVNLNTLCPAPLRSDIDSGGTNYGCSSACVAGLGNEAGGNRDCCTGQFGTPDHCKADCVDYYHLFKDNCPNSYAFAYDEASGTALWTCPAPVGSEPDYTVTFCASGAGYVGSTTASDMYDYNTAPSSCASE